MKWFAGLRALALLRRGVLALERLADSQQCIAEFMADRESRRRNHIVRKPKLTSFGQLDVAESTKLWQRRQAELMVEEPD
jgi:hypothetical protein